MDQASSSSPLSQATLLKGGLKMRVLAGLHLGGASLTARDDLLVGEGASGNACWGPAQQLRDLELRLGLWASAAAHALRVAPFAARMANQAPEGRYYFRSFLVGALGTAAPGLELRDLLVESGSEGKRVSAGGARLHAIEELEQLNDPILPAGAAENVMARSHRQQKPISRFGTGSSDFSTTMVTARRGRRRRSSTKGGGCG